MPSLDQIPCPTCKKTTLRIVFRLVAKNLGTHSLAGEQLKLAAEGVPHIQCTECGYEQAAKPDK